MTLQALQADSNPQPIQSANPCGSPLTQFIRHRKQTDGSPLIMAHVVYGYPSVDASLQLMETLLNAGVELLEVQFPFSDPIADGPSILHACHQAIANHPRMADCLEAIRSLAQRYSDSRILLMSYLNPLLRHGLSPLIEDATGAISGIIIPDLPIQQSGHYRRQCLEAGIDPIWMLTPDTSPRRCQQICAMASGMLYCVSRRGVTGNSKSSQHINLPEYLGAIAATTSLPLAVGFGIRDHQQIRELQGFATVAIVGSAILDAYHDGGVGRVKETLQQLRQGGNTQQ